MVSDLLFRLPEGALFFLSAPEGLHDLVRHVLEKDLSPRERLPGLPFSRAYVVETTGTVTSVFVSYNPSSVLAAIDDALPPETALVPY